MIVLAVDPGNMLSGISLLQLGDEEKILGCWFVPNKQAEEIIKDLAAGRPVKDYSNVESPTKRNIILDSTIKERLGEEPVYPVPEHIVIELMQCYSQVVGNSVFETCIWTGLFIQAFCQSIGDENRNKYSLITRSQVKSTIAGLGNAKDKHINRAVEDRLGPKGTMKNPGGTYGTNGDIIAAVAVGLTFKELYDDNIRVKNSPKKRKILSDIQVSPHWRQLEADGGDRSKEDW